VSAVCSVGVGDAYGLDLSVARCHYLHCTIEARLQSHLVDFMMEDMVDKHRLRDASD
jgi:hypothetical protein